MSEPQAEGGGTSVKDYLLVIFAGVLAHPSTFAEVSEFVDDTIVGSDDAVTSTLWRYLCAAKEEANLHEATAELICAEVDEHLALVEQLTDAAIEVTPSRTVSTARKLARAVVNARRKHQVKSGLDSAAIVDLDVETLTSEAVRAYPHTTTTISPLTLQDCEDALDECYTVIPTGFSYVDRASAGFIVGELHEMCARTGDGKSTTLYSLARNQFFAYGAKHRDDPWWQQFGSDWDSRGGRLSQLLTPCHAGHDDTEEDYQPPHVLWFSLEEPVSQVLGRFYCDLLSIDRKRWMTREHFRKNMRRSYASQIRHINEVVSSGRLTIVDYSTRKRKPGAAFDAAVVEQTLADVTKRVRAWARACAKADERDGVERPRLCLIDYAQLINVPEDQGGKEHALLAKVSTTLRNLAPECDCALLTSLMLLRDSEDNEPNKDQIKGSSQFAQDAARIFTLWPMGTRARKALNTELESLQPGSVSDETAAAEWEDLTAQDASADEDDTAIFDAPYEVSEDDAAEIPGPAIIPHLTRAKHEMRWSCEKDRFGDAYQARLNFEGKYARVTEGLPDEGRTDEDGNPIYTSYREHPQIAAIISTKKKGKKD